MLKENNNAPRSPVPPIAALLTAAPVLAADVALDAVVAVVAAGVVVLVVRRVVVELRKIPGAVVEGAAVVLFERATTEAETVVVESV
jgi:hypothetical protein